MAFINELALQRNYVGYSLTEIAYNLIADCYHYGERIESRNGQCLSLHNVRCCLLNPQARVLNLVGRKNSFAAICAELFWVLSGSNEINPYLSFFLKRASDYSDDKQTWRGGYGKRLWQYNQFESVLRHFKANLFTRRAIQTIYDASVDNYIDYSRENPRMLDVPCNNWIQYFVIRKTSIDQQPIDYFCMKVVQRSGDIIWGVTNVNIFIFSVIHEIMFEFVKYMYPDANLRLGAYYHEITDAHIYDNKLIMNQVNDILNHTSENMNNIKSERSKRYPSILLEEFLQKGNSINDLRALCKYIVDECSKAIENRQEVSDSNIALYSRISCNSYDVLSNNSALYKYLSEVINHINKKVKEVQ